MFYLSILGTNLRKTYLGQANKSYLHATCWAYNSLNSQVFSRCSFTFISPVTKVRLNPMGRRKLLSVYKLGRSNKKPRAHCYSAHLGSVCTNRK